MRIFVTWVLYFFVYSFIGWCIESTIVSVQHKRFVNRGFLRAPMLPLYGSGAVIILLVTYPFAEDGNPFLIYLAGAVAATVLEYITAVIMETLFKTRYWDYSNEKLNFQGRICLKSTLFWGVLSLFMVYVIHPPIEKLIAMIPFVGVCIIDGAVGAWFIFDVVVSFKAAFDVNKVLAVMDKARNEAASIRLQLEMAASEGKESISEKSDELKTRLAELKEQYANYTERMSFFAKNMVRSNPSLKHNRFNTTLNDLKERLTRK